MADLEQLADTLYSRFILRDFVGKVVPGALLTVSTLQSVTFPHSLLDNLSSLPAAIWLALLGFCWIAGFIVQWLGAILGTRSYPHIGDKIPGTSARHTKANTPASDVEFHRAVLKYRHLGSQETQQLERFTVIKEACGNGYVSLILASAVCLAAAMWTVRHLGFVGSIEWLTSGITSFWPGLVILVVSIVALWRVHREHVEKEWNLLSGVKRDAV